MIIRFLPQGLRRRLIDGVYGADRTGGMHLYWIGLTGLWLLFAASFLGWGFTAPTSQDRAETFARVNCVDWVGAYAVDDQAENGLAEAPQATENSLGSASPEDEAGSFPSCEEQAGRLRSEFEQAVQIVQSLRDGTDPIRVTAPAGSALRRWIDGAVCSLGGASSRADRARVAALVRSGYGECSRTAALVAGFPLTIRLGVAAGTGLTVLLIALSGFALFLHLARLRATRAAYRRLYASEH